jgi:hypothetical protein
VPAYQRSVTAAWIVINENAGYATTLMDDMKYREEEGHELGKKQANKSRQTGSEVVEVAGEGEVEVVFLKSWRVSFH